MAHTIENSDIRLAVIVDPDMPIGLLANTVATISIGIGAINNSLGNVDLTDNDGVTVKNSASLPVPILQADQSSQNKLVQKALAIKNNGSSIEVVVFPDFARKLHNFEEYLDEFPKRSISNEAIVGIGLIGSSKEVKSLTGSLKLLR